jgi:serine/threonine protein kinase
MQMVLRALTFCHARWVLHRDIKPNNFLIAPDGEFWTMLSRWATGRSRGCCKEHGRRSLCLGCSVSLSELPKVRVLRLLRASCAGHLKLADFGLSRIFGSPDRKYTNQVGALC